MEKPISMRIMETKESIIQIVNNSGLPASLLTEVIGGIALQVNQLAKTEYDNDRKSYIEQLEKEQAESKPVVVKE